MKTIILLIILALTASASFGIDLYAPTEKVDDTFTAPFTVSDGTGVTAFQFIVHYDNNLIQFDECTSDNGLFTLCNEDEPGQVRTVGYGAYGMTNNEPLRMTFSIKKQAQYGDVSPITMTQSRFWTDVWLPVTVNDGEIIVAR